MSGWDKTRRLNLPEPWQDFWIDLYEDPPMGDWLAAQKTASGGLQALIGMEPDEASKAGDRVVSSLAALFAGYHILDREGAPVDMAAEGAFGKLSAGLITHIFNVVRRALEGEGLPPPLAKRERSRVPSSPGSRSRRATSSGR